MDRDKKSDDAGSSGTATASGRAPMKLRERFGQPPPDWVNDSDRAFGSGEADRLERPAACPFCNATIIDTLATVITPATCWRCRTCEATWTIASRAASSRLR